MEQNTIVINQHVEECSKLELIRQGWIILDKQSMVNIFCDHTLLKNIRQVRGRINIHCNVGIVRTNWVGYLEGFETVWCYK